MERFLGPLLEPPYRTKDRRPNPTGDGCLYRAKDYRNVTIELDRENGEMGYRMLAGTQGTVDQALGTGGDTPATPGGGWDKAASSFGRFIALKGAATIIVDPMAARLGLDAQAKIVRLALPPRPAARLRRWPRGPQPQGSRPDAPRPVLARDGHRSRGAHGESA